MSDSYLKFTRTTVGNKICSLVGLPIPPVIKRADESPEALVSGILCGSHQKTTGLGASVQELLSSENVTSEATDSDKFGGLVFDATGIQSSAESCTLHQFFNQHLKKLNKSGKIVVIGLSPKQCKNPLQATVQRGLIGFVKSIAKEVGRKGATANLIYANQFDNVDISSPLRFFLSYRSAYVNGQVISLQTDTLASVKSDESNQDQEVSWNKPLTGKVALVTGASRGIGASIAKTLSRDGAKVLGLDMPQTQAELSVVMSAIGGEAILANITDPNAPEMINQAIQKLSAGVDMVIHNAGITRDKMMVSMPESMWEQVIDVNLSSIERINAHLLENDSINTEGRIVCVSSISGIAGNLGQTNYALSKASIIGMIESTAPQLSAKNITINAVAPGFIETDMTAAVPVFTRFAGRRVCALSQGGLPIDVAETISFLLAPQSKGITANLVRVCGLNIMGA